MSVSQGEPALAPRTGITQIIIRNSAPAFRIHVQVLLHDDKSKDLLVNLQFVLELGQRLRLQGEVQLPDVRLHTTPARERSEGGVSVGDAGYALAMSGIRKKKS